MFNIVSTYNIGSTLDVLASILEEQYYMALNLDHSTDLISEIIKHF